MHWILFGIAVTLIVSAIWFLIEYKRELRSNREIFGEYLENQRKLQFNSRSRREKYIRKNNK